MRLALFDVDETLIRGDSEVLWCRYLTENGIRDMRGIDGFMKAYEAGNLDFDAFSRFQLRPLAELPEDLLVEHRSRFLAEMITPRLFDTALARVIDHSQRGHEVLAISAAYEFIAAPVANLAGIDRGLYTDAEHDGNAYTGRVQGTPCFREGKVERLTSWLAERGEGPEVLESSWFYSDSHNDLPLLRRVGNPVAVRPDPKLRAVAEASGWEVLEDTLAS